MLNRISSHFGMSSTSWRIKWATCCSLQWMSSAPSETELINLRIKLHLWRKRMVILTNLYRSCSCRLILEPIKNKSTGYKMRSIDWGQSSNSIEIMRTRILKISIMKCLIKQISKIWSIWKTEFSINWETWSNKSSTNLPTKMMSWNDSPNLAKR